MDGCSSRERERERDVGGGRGEEGNEVDDGFCLVPNGCDSLVLKRLEMLFGTAGRVQIYIYPS